MVSALDKTTSLPIALCGSLAKPVENYLPANLIKRLVSPKGDSVTGALLMIQNQLKTR
jgi:glucosamine kinase